MKKKVIVIGAGPAGCVASSFLQKNGVDVTILEKSIFPRFVIGESLLPATMDHLEEAGLLHGLRELPFQKKQGAIFFDQDKSCSFTFADQFSKSWSWTWQVKRADFDLALAKETEKNGVRILFGHEVTSVDIKSANRQIVCAREKDGLEKRFECYFIIDASGYGRVLPRLFNLNQPSSLPNRGSIYAHVRDKHRNSFDESRITIHGLKDDCWIWQIPFSDHTSSIGIVGDQNRIEELAQDNGKEFINFICGFDAFNERYERDSFEFLPKTTIGYSLGIKQMYGPGYALCGNSTEFLDPIFSSGVALATATGLLTAKLTLKQFKTNDVDWEKDYEEKINKGLAVFKTYIEGWYNGDLKTIFFNPKIDTEIKRQICSVLAGHVWDEKNPFVKNHHRLLSTLAKVINIENRTKTA